MTAKVIIEKEKLDELRKHIIETDKNYPSIKSAKIYVLDKIISLSTEQREAQEKGGPENDDRDCCRVCGEQGGRHDDDCTAYLHGEIPKSK